MSFLDPPRCPNCNSTLDLTELYGLAEKAGNTLSGRVGILCPVCGTPLRVLQTRAFLVGLLTFFVLFALLMATYIAAPVARGSRDYSIRLAIFAAVMLCANTWERRSIPRLLTVRLLENGEVVRFPLAPVPKAEEAEPSSALQLAPVEDSRPAWTCVNCGEENPGNFDECWKCQTWRADEKQSADPRMKAE